MGGSLVEKRAVELASLRPLRHQPGPSLSNVGAAFLSPPARQAYSPYSAEAVCP